MRQFHFAIPGVKSFLDRICSYIAADPNSRIWTVVPPEELPVDLRGCVKPINRVRLPSALGKWILRHRLAQQVRDNDFTVFWAMNGLFSPLHRVVQGQSTALTVHACVSPIPLWYDDVVVPPSVRDPQLSNLRLRNLRMERRASRYADLVVVQVEAYRDAYARAFNRPVSTVRVVPNAVVAERLVESGPAVMAYLEMARNHPTFIHIGNFWRFKGTMDLIESFANVREKYPEARLLMVGSTVASMQREIDDLIRGLRLEKHIIFLGRVPQPQLFTLIKACMALVHPSYYEGMPRVILEAMDLGVPVVASNIFGIRAIDRQGAAIRYTTPGDIESLSAQMRCTIENRTESLKMARAGKALIDANYRPKHIGRTIRELCLSVREEKIAGTLGIHLQ